MSKIQKYCTEINKVDLRDKTNQQIADTLKDKFVEVYGQDFVDRGMCRKDKGFAIVPAWIKTDNEKKIIGLLHVCVQDSGEHYGTQFYFDKLGWVDQQEIRDHFSKEEIKKLFPYNYRPLIEIVGDIHTGSYF